MPLLILLLFLSMQYYKPYFSGRLHRNLIASHPDGDSAVISIEKPEGAICRVLCRTKNVCLHHTHTFKQTHTIDEHTRINNVRIY